MLRIVRPVLGFSVACLILVQPAAAPPVSELVYFSSGQIMEVSGHQTRGNNIVLSLKGGGEILCDSRLINRIEAKAVSVLREVRPALPAAFPAVRSFEGRPYARFVESAGSRYGVDPGLLHAMIAVESSYQSDAVSPRGAMGLMQLMPATAEHYQVADPFDPASNIDAGARHMRRLLDRFGVARALAAYNAGEAAVRRFHGIPPHRETRQYVKRVLDLVNVAADD